MSSLTSSAHVHVFDLDGVVRDFSAADPNPGIENALGLSPGTILATAFQPHLLHPTVLGQRSFAEWFDLICADLEQHTDSPGLVRPSMSAWREHRGRSIPSTVSLIEHLREAGLPVFLFTNGTDHIPHELELLDLARLFDGVLNSAVLGAKKPDPSAYAAAHLGIERTLGRGVERADVHFTDDRPENVAAAREFGWQATLLEPTT